MRNASLIGIRFARALGIGMLLVLATAVAEGTETAQEADFRLAFFYNFAKFVEWPPEAIPGTGAITACVTGNPALTTALNRAVAGRSINGHAFVVSNATVDESIRSCHLLYIAGPDEKLTRHVIQMLSGHSVFSVSDFDRFAALGGVANFFLDNGRLRFVINVDAVTRARLRVSSKLLALAVTIKDQPSNR